MPITADSRTLINCLIENISKVIEGKSDTVELVLVALKGGNIPARSDSETGDDFVFPLRPFAWAGGVIGLVLVGMFLWWLSLRKMDAPTRAYARMSWLLGMKRRPNETSIEFATNLGGRTVDAMEPATHIAIEFQRRVYSGPVGSTDRPDDYEKQLTRAWRKVALALVVHRIRQLGGIGP